MTSIRNAALDGDYLKAALAAARKSSDALSLGTVMLLALIISIPLTGEIWPGRVLVLAHIVFWVAALVSLQWSIPRGQPVSWSRVVSGAALSGAVAGAATLFVLASQSRGVPTAGQVMGEIRELPSLLLVLAFSGPAVIIGRRVLTPDIERERPDSRIARQSQEALSVIFHELRRPLTLLVASSELALDPATSEEKRQELLSSVHRNALRLGTDLEELLETMRIQSSRLRINRRPVDLGDLIHEIAGEFRETQHAGEIEVTVSQPVDGIVSVDPVLMKTVLRNLLANAIKHSPKSAPVAMRVWREGERVSISVEDEGPGVPEAHREQIFEQFWQVPGSAGGFGLGLYLSRQLVNAHGGRIWVEPREIRGARFIVSLPARHVPGTLPVSRGADRPHPITRTQSS